MRDVYECYAQCVNISRRSQSELGSLSKTVDTAEESAAYTAISNVPNVEFSWACQALLQIVPSEAAVERTFSAQGMLMTKRRNRLDDLSVMNEMTLKFNHMAMQVEEQPRTFDSLACVISLSDDSEREEDESDSDSDEEIEGDEHSGNINMLVD